EMDDEEVKEMCDELSIKNTDNLNRQALSAATLTLFKMGGFKSYQLAVIVANAVAKTILGRGLSLAGNQVLTRTLSFLTGPVG
ncbi:ubiquinol-cytochrome C chaperone family protein, partial [Acinetobacter baumannii]